MFDGMFQHSYEAETCYIPWDNYLISLWIQLLLYSTHVPRPALVSKQIKVGLRVNVYRVQSKATRPNVWCSCENVFSLVLCIYVIKLQKTASLVFLYLSSGRIAVARFMRF